MSRAELPQNPLLQGLSAAERQRVISIQLAEALSAYESQDLDLKDVQNLLLASENKKPLQEAVNDTDYWECKWVSSTSIGKL